MVSIPLPALMGKLSARKGRKKAFRSTTKMYVCRVPGRPGIAGKPNVAHAMEELSGKYSAVPPA